MTTQARRRPPVAVFGCLGVLLAAVVGLWSAKVSSVGAPVWAWASDGAGDVVPSLTTGQDWPRLAVLPQRAVLSQPARAAARIVVPEGGALGGPAVVYVVVGLALRVLVARGPRTLRPRAGICQHGTRAPPSWS